MNIDYSSILKTDRVQPEFAVGGSVLTEAENDRSKILFSSAFRRLQQHAQTLPLDTCRSPRSKLSHALQVAQVGRGIASQIAARLENENLATGVQCAALITITEAACLARDIGCAPFGPAGEAAIQRWFADHGPDKIRAACRTYGGRALDAADPRVLNALADFHEFGSHPQGLRVLAKFHGDHDPRALNLTKACIASYMPYLRMAGVKTGEASGKSTDKPGFFSTEAGLVKNIWSTFAYDTEPQRFPLSYVVDTACDIVSCLCDLEEAIDNQLLPMREAIDTVRDDWLSAYIPVDPDRADEQILAVLNAAAKGKNDSGDDFGFADWRRALIAALSDYAARRYVDRHEEVFAGTLDSLLAADSGPGSLLAAVKQYCRCHVYSLEPIQRHELTGHTIVHGLLGNFGILLTCTRERFQLALDFSSTQEASGKSPYIERKLLALIPAEYRNTYSHLIAQLGNGRDEEFEEWNARAHLLVDFIAGMTESAAITTFRSLSGTIPAL